MDEEELAAMEAELDAIGEELEDLTEAVETSIEENGR
ncbi:hypothetical protein [Plectonema phage JingP1]|uniref:Uncharacterized protein n=1 Tax=Plectonema phage JingP1 TaxID=2961687 RepID=A0A9E7T2Y7_9CAUD|nr:hypothetical protein [Plectonema phage JingP1]UVD33205.1 hypothetical protein [Plectonema phage Pbo-yong3]